MVNKTPFNSMVTKNPLSLLVVSTLKEGNIVYPMFSNTTTTDYKLTINNPYKKTLYFCC